VAPRSRHFTFEQVGDRAWAEVAVDSGGAVAAAGFASLEDGRRVKRCEIPTCERGIEDHRVR
jgi:hypothetical protein